MVYSTIALVALVFVAMTLLLPRSTFFQLTSFDHINPLFLGMRYSLYGAIYFRWAAIALYFNPKVAADVVASSKQWVLTLIVIYECIFGLDLIQLVL